MAVRRPTFHESWYRVAELRPRLLSSVRSYRQHFRGQLWYVLENPANNEFSRLSSQAYRFVGLLDGQRTVAEVWHLCNEQMGDDAPTQGEIIQLLGQLYGANLLYGHLPPDTQSLLNRYRTRVRRRIQSFLTNLLFIRIPLLDPDSILNRWVGTVGRVFSLPGLAVWLAFITIGLYFVIGNFGELVRQSADILAPGNLVYLYLSLVFVKVCHEFSHAFACKKFGQLEGSGGQVHTMGVMFLVFVPLPYVDASSAWAFRRKWHRVIVGTAGVMAELVIAAIAAVFWANTSTGTLHIIAYNIIFIASVSTLLFNGNPLLRFDAYYVLSDLTEIPNLAQRSRYYIYYLVKRYCWDIRHAYNPSHSLGEQIWFVCYGIASTAWRIYISIRILLFLNNRLPEELFIVVPILAFSAIIMWVFAPIGRFVRFLMTSPELARTRQRAVLSTAGTLFLLVIVLGLLPFPDHVRVEGVVEPVHLAVIHAQVDGFVQDYLQAPADVSPQAEPLIQAANPELEAEQKGLLADRRGLEAKWRLAQTQDTAAAQIFNEQLKALDEQIARVDSQLESLRLRAPLRGKWVSADIDKTKGMYIRRGERIGLVGSLDNVLIRGTAGQAVAAMLIEQPCKGVEIRIRKRPDKTIKGSIEKILPAGLEILPSQALGYSAGGSMPTAPRDERGIKAAERFFEVRIKPDPDDSLRLLSGQRVIARIQLASKPLAEQCYNGVRQLFQRRFRI